MEDPSTDTLRKLAPCWTLEGDERLLTILQNTHQRIISKCQETNCQLEQMVTALDDASISLQNVNNQFMSLSSSQFIERRVYDDDVDVATDTPETKESQKPSLPDEVSILKRSISVIEGAHEVITIIDDSESDSDEDAPHRLVMKPKDVYSDRPLPYIIGSDPWKNKWHAGLLPEDSDSDSSVSKPDQDSDQDQYSQSEPEDVDCGPRNNVRDAPTAYHPRNLSDSSSDVPSEATPPSKPTPADVAREIARRLGGADLPQSVEPEPEYDEPTKPAVRKIYKPQEPVASTIFPDEPPPLDSHTDSDPDIFADLHRKQPYNQPYRGPAADQLFGGSDTDEGGDIFSDFANQPPSKPTSLFDAGPKPNMFNKQPVTEHPSKSQPQATDQPIRTVEQPTRNTTDTESDRGVKKPVGGISLFGSNKGNEIGAAILKRNQRKSSTSDEESTTESISQSSPAKEQAKKEKDIFDDLFAKSENKTTKPKVDNVVRDIKQHIQKKDKEVVKKDTPKPVDLFSDNLFDDIDDIFTTSVVKTTDKKQKSIFDDDDDLFSDITETKPVKHEVKDKNDNKKSLFDSDDDLFSENVATPSISNKPQDIKDNNSTADVNKNPTTVIEKPPEIVKPIVNERSTKIAETTKVTKESTSIFDDDDDDDIFSNINTNKKIINVQNVAKTESINVTKNIATSKDVFKSPSLFDDDDDDESDLFTDSVKTKIETKDVDYNKVTPKTIIESEVTKNKIEITNSVSADNIFNKTEEKHTDIVVNSIKPESLKEITIEEEDIFRQVSTDNIDTNKPIATDNDVLKENIDNEFDDDTQNEQNSFESSSYDTAPEKENNNMDNVNTNIKPTLIQESIDNDKEILSDNDFSEPDSQIESLLETKPEVSNNITATDKNTSDIPIIASGDKVTEAKTKIHNIFVSSLLEEDIFASPNNIPNTETKTEIDNNPETIPEADIFTNIVTEPPDFEKPKEPKRSKNVNALFDDDSDDESLFFKKDDVVTDEKPDDFTVKQDRLFDIFTDEPPPDVDFTKIDDELDDDLFSTLPTPKAPSEIPKPNVDFDIPVLEIPIADDEIENETTQNTNNKSEISTLPKETDISQSKVNKDDVITSKKENESLINKETANIFSDTNAILKEPVSLIGSVTDKKNNLSDDDELFQSLPVQLPKSKTEIFTKDQHKDDQSDEELFKSLPNIDKSVPKEELPKSMLGRNKSFKLPAEKSWPISSDSKSDKPEVKKVGKLKVGFNINVNALLPGASPKKVKPVDNTDGSTQSQVEIEKDVPKLTKLVSFEGKPESEVLDNKLSKERPRIQVKRRPSTRKARREAVRKSGIDFGEDSTDNSSSIDDPPKVKVEIAETVDNKTKNGDNNENNEEIIIKNEVNYLDSPKIEPKDVKSEDQLIKTDNNIQESDNVANIEPLKQPVKSDSTTKIVYILNDEDIFNTSAVETSDTKNITTTNAIKEPEFKATPDIVKVTEDKNANLESNTGIKTLGSVYKPTESDDNKKSNTLFGEDEHSDDDDELFKNKKPVAKATIFDSDSEGELFGSTNKVEKVMKVEKKAEKVVKEVKGSLFGDDHDDDDLFGVKTKKIVDPQPAPSRSTPIVKETPKSTQPVFEDPLSMFGDED